MTDNGELLLAILEEKSDGSSGWHIRIIPPRIQQNIPATAACVFRDVSGVFTTIAPPNLRLGSIMAATVKNEFKPTPPGPDTLMMAASGKAGGWSTYTWLYEGMWPYNDKIDAESLRLRLKIKFKTGFSIVIYSYSEI